MNDTKPRSKVSQQQDAAELVNVGLELQRLRLRQTRTIEAIAESLKLTTDMVNYLESNNFDKLPNKVFVRGYIRNYLNLLGVPKERADDLVAHFDYNISISDANAGQRQSTAAGMSRRHEAAPRRIKLIEGQQQYKIDNQSGRWKIWLALAAVLLLAIVGWLLFIGPDSESVASTSSGDINLLQNSSETASQAGGSSGIAAAPTATPLADEDLIISFADDNSIDLAAAAPEQPTEPRQQLSRLPVLETNPEINISASVAPPPAIAGRIEQPEPNVLLPMGSMPETAEILQTNASVQFRLSFAAESWVQVIDSEGLDIANGLQQNSDEINYNAIAPISFHFGNSGATDLVFQGQEIDFSAFVNRNVSRFIMNADGSLERWF